MSAQGSRANILGGIATKSEHTLPVAAVGIGTFYHLPTQRCITQDGCQRS